MTIWYYIKDGDRQGPLGEEALRDLCLSGHVQPSTLVWRDGLAEWTEAQQCTELQPYFVAGGPVAPPSPWAHLQTERQAPARSADAAPEVEAAEAPLADASVKQVRPWVRYWARTLDMFFFSFFCAIVLAMLSIELSRYEVYFFGIACLCVFVLVETAFMGIMGTTPGKALLRVRVRQQNGNPLTFSQAFARATGVWVRGIGMGIPILVLVAEAYSYYVLRKHGVTPWDKTGGFVVSHGRIGVLRCFALISCALLVMMYVIETTQL